MLPGIEMLNTTIVGMRKPLFSWLLFLLSFTAFDASACETEVQKHQAASILYRNNEFRAFTCGDDSCDEETMEGYLDFTVNQVPGNPTNLCFVATSASVKNRYVGIFTFNKGNVELKLVAFGRYVRARPSKYGRTELQIYDVTDSSKKYRLRLLQTEAPPERMQPQ